MKTLSSSLTFFMKFCLLPLWTLFVLVLYYLLKDSQWLELETMHYIVLWITINVVIFFNMFSIKTVSIDDKQIYVSGLRHTEVIPFTEVEYVSGSRFGFPEQVWFRTKDKRIFVFMAKVRFSIFQFHRHPMVEELAYLCGLEDW